MNPNQKWNVKNGLATIDFQSLMLKIDTANPSTGGVIQSPGNSGDAAAALFQINDGSNADSTDAETYCRGRDLITRYPANEHEAIAREIYWRLGTDADAELDSDCVSVETIYSLQTDLLDSSPQPSVPSIFHNSSQRWFLAGQATDGDSWTECAFEDACFAAGEADSRIACLIELASGFKLLQTVYPSDLRAIEASTCEDQLEIHWQLRSDFLEKGVIRRLRMLTVLGEKETDDQQLLSSASRFYSSELPLTV